MDALEGSLSREEKRRQANPKRSNPITESHHLRHFAIVSFLEALCNQLKSDAIFQRYQNHAEQGRKEEFEKLWNDLTDQPPKFDDQIKFLKLLIQVTWNVIIKSMKNEITSKIDEVLSNAQDAQDALIEIANLVDPVLKSISTKSPYSPDRAQEAHPEAVNLGLRCVRCGAEANRAGLCGSRAVFLGTRHSHG
ncbi:MAG: hypothetical protein DRQ56_09160 [Gammaproteobacteria bacterium]|nr:MAG: hypothetical protein DRQ56_09160 [Gammaproteobacteria bacterium]